MKYAISDYVTIAVISFALIYDGWLSRKGEGNTLSFRWAQWAKVWPIIPFLAGVLMGHLFWPNRGYC